MEEEGEGCEGDGGEDNAENPKVNLMQMQNFIYNAFKA